MCGIIGMVGHSDVIHSLYEGLSMLQHRGQDAAGIVTWSEEGQFCLRKNTGLVRDVFREEHLKILRGRSGIGHVRYPTAGADSSAEAQPLYVNSPYGIVMGHNGNLTNAEVLAQEIFAKDRRHINTFSDSEVLLNVFADEIGNSKSLSKKTLFNAITKVHKRAEGAYAVVGMIAHFGLFAFRDPYGLRPLILGKKKNLVGEEWVVASESVAFDILGFERERDILPGEAIFIDTDGKLTSFQCGERKKYSPCLFEYVYFARPDTIMDGISVYQARLKMGEMLAKRIAPFKEKLQVEVVMPIPDTSRTAALELAKGLKVDFREGFIKNRYIGRTFIMPGQKLRTKSVRRKLNPIHSELNGKNVLLVDDSIVRGTTSREIVRLAKSAGAKKIYFASASPPVRHQYVYGIDMPSQQELIAHERSVEEVCEFIGADALFYQELDDMISVLKALNPKLDGFDASCFNGCYTTGNITQSYLNKLLATRKLARVVPSIDSIEMHNTQ